MKNTLAQLFHGLLFKTKVGPERLQGLITAYVNKQRLSVRSSVNVGSLKGNLRKQLFADSLSWGTYIKGLKTLNPVSIEITTTLHYKNTSVSHTVTVSDNSEDEDVPGTTTDDKSV